MMDFLNKPSWRRRGRYERKRSFGPKDLMLLIHDLACVLVAVTLIFTFFVRMGTVFGMSMYPTLTHQDRLLVLSNVWYAHPQRGDIVVALAPEFSQEPIVKRVIAVAGDRVDIDFSLGIVYVNGEALEEPYVNAPTTADFGAQGIGFPLVVEENHVFLMGDNRNDSYDSRYYAIGQVDTRNILGKVLVLAFPGEDPENDKRDFSRLGLID